MVKKKSNPGNTTAEQRTMAAIDIGSNAVRLLVKRAAVGPDGRRRMKKLLLLRVPLRLGVDVFADGRLSDAKVKKLERLMKSYSLLMKIYDVSLYRACATSAMRDAANGAEVIDRIRKKAGILIDIISGQEEARIIYSNHLECMEDRSGSHLYVDVGGGSTEVNLLVDGVLRFSASYDVGTIRLLSGRVTDDAWQHMTSELRSVTVGLSPVNIIGTGGNINKLYRLSPEKDKDSKRLPVEALRRLHEGLAAMDTVARAEAYDLKEDRADVIVPAAEIFLRVAGTVGAGYIHVPVIGLVDGIIDGLCAQTGPGAEDVL